MRFVTVLITWGMLAAAGTALSQGLTGQTSNISLSGPRVGFTYLVGDAASRLKKNHAAYSGLVQFGYQFEKRFFSSNTGGPTALIEFVPLVGGLDQGLAIPSVTWLFGVRTESGFEVGIGPNLTMVDHRLDVDAVRSGIVVAAGISLRAGDLNFPVNFSMARSEGGMRFSLLTGFNVP